MASSSRAAFRYSPSSTRRAAASRRASVPAPRAWGATIRVSPRNTTLQRSQALIEQRASMCELLLRQIQRRKEHQDILEPPPREREHSALEERGTQSPERALRWASRSGIMYQLETGQEPGDAHLANDAPAARNLLESLCEYTSGPCQSLPKGQSGELLHGRQRPRARERVRVVRARVGRLARRTD